MRGHGDGEREKWRRHKRKRFCKENNKRKGRRYEVHLKAAGMLNSPRGQLFKVRRVAPKWRAEPNMERETW